MYSLEIGKKKYPSKILLFGEYTVITGSPALAMPNYFFSGSWTWDETSKKDKSLQWVADHIKNSNLLSSKFDWQKLNDDINNGLFFQSNIPYGYGLGSSGALVAGLFDVYGLDKSEDPQEIKNILAETESVFHGTSSGIDPLVSYLDTCIKMQNQNVQPLSISNISYFNMGLLDTGMKRETGPLVNIFNTKLTSNEEFRYTVEQLSAIVNKSIDAILTSSPSSHKGRI